MKYMFTAKWCGNCEVMKPIVEDIEGVEIVDIEEQQEYVDKFTIMSLPTFVVEHKDWYDALVGVKDKKSIEEFYGKS